LVALTVAALAWIGAAVALSVALALALVALTVAASALVQR